MKDLRRLSIIVYLLALVLSAPFQNFNVTFSIALGGFISIANLSFLESLLSHLFKPESDSRLAGAVSSAFFFIRFVVIALVFFIFANAGWIDFIALLAGLSVTVISIFVWSFAKGPGFKSAFGADALDGKRNA